MPSDQSAERETSRERVREGFRIIDLSAVGIAFPVAILLGYFGGRWIGGWLGSASVGAMVGTLLGIAGGFYNLLKMVVRFAPRQGPEGAVGGAPPAAAAPPTTSTDRDDAGDLDDWDRGDDRGAPDAEDLGDDRGAGGGRES